MAQIEDWLIQNLSVVDSTQKYAKSLINNNNANHATVIIAEQQNDGYGRYNNRRWVARKGDISITLILRLSNIKKFFPELLLSQVSYLTAVSIGQSILTFFPEIMMSYKWVNDILINNRKLGGILLEQVNSEFLLAGIGINLVSKAELAELNGISLSCLNYKLSKNELINEILKNFKYYYNHWLTYGFSPIRYLWLKHSAYLGKLIQLTYNQNIIKGIFEGIDEDGALLLKEFNATTYIKHKIYAADNFSICS